MPVNYKIDAVSRVVRATVRGLVTLEQEVDCLENFLGDPGFETGFGLLFDHRARGTVASVQHVRGMARAFQRHLEQLGKTRLAIVVSREASFGMARMFSILTENMPIDTHIFKDITEAEHWLHHS